MSRIIASAAIRGAHTIYNRAEKQLKDTIAKFGEAQEISFPVTAYYLPVVYSMTGTKVEKLGDMLGPLEQAKSLLPEIPTENLWLPYLGNALDAGIATLIAEEIIEGLKFLNGNPVDGIWLGPTNDAILREQGIKLVDGRMPGFAACVGAPETKEQAVKLARDLQERNILVFMSSSTNGSSMAEML
ncbi:MAG: CO dehydrogenase/CO-methylating acetyl-CoA synthase complex subunit beta, partial [bacterium]|nr:CO dehydrogenase/CO-methylating acetyl-CoA synthase complex subunit beta [bacterium]